MTILAAVSIKLVDIDHRGSRLRAINIAKSNFTKICLSRGLARIFLQNLWDHKSIYVPKDNSNKISKLDTHLALWLLSTEI